jgi:hypothetical protein
MSGKSENEMYVDFDKYYSQERVMDELYKLARSIVIDLGIEEWNIGYINNQLCGVRETATAAERERCAKQIEDYPVSPKDYPLMEALAAAIRKGESDG